MSSQEALDPDAFQALVDKGQHLFKMMRMSEAEFRTGPGLGQSRFVSLGDPVAYGWTQVVNSWRPDGLFKAVYDDLSASSAPEDNHVVVFNHGPSSGNYEIAVNVKAGIIQACSSISPTRRGWTQDIGYPALHFWSDLAYLAWLTVAQPAAHSAPAVPSFVIRENVQNALTHKVLVTLLRRTGYQDLAPNWPGYEFSLDDERSDALAILATPNGAGVAWFLIDHKEEFGVRVLSKVKVFMEGDNFNLLFYTRDVL